MRLQLELFVDDVERSLAFYNAVLGFRVKDRKEDGYTALALGTPRSRSNGAGACRPTTRSRPDPASRSGAASRW